MICKFSFAYNLSNFVSIKFGLTKTFSSSTLLLIDNNNITNDIKPDDLHKNNLDLDKSDEEMEDVENSDEYVQGDTDNESQGGTFPNRWHMNKLIEKFQGKTREEVEEFFNDKKEDIKAESIKYKNEIAEDNVGVGMDAIEDYYNNRKDEDKLLKQKLYELSEVKSELYEHLNLDPSTSPSQYKPSDDEESSSKSGSNSPKSQTSLLDDYADTSLQFGDWFASDD